MARAAGFAAAWRVESAAEWEARLDDVLSLPGPVFVSAAVEPGNQRPLRRHPDEPARYLKVSLADSARVVREALRQGAPV
jgi:thiamine pyrophosphate-dependent acetolactate synthase large subunit-like protein